MRVSNSLWKVGVLLSGVSQSSQKAVPDAALAARQDGIPPLQTVTIPGTVSTVTGATLTQVVTETLPARTTTVTEDGHLVISTSPAQNTVKTKVLEISPYPVPLPGSVTVVTPISQITLCPEPTGRVDANLRMDKSLLFGCSAGFVCNPPMPDTCNFWPGEPSPDFACRPEDCIPAPPTRNEVTWDGDQIAYYSPAWGYFHLDPRPFGLSYDIYAYGSSSNAKRSTFNRKVLGKRQTPGDNTPPNCIFDCDNALTRGQNHGEPGICDDSQFRTNLRLCVECVVEYGQAQNVTNPNPRDYIGGNLERWFNQCSGGNSTTTNDPGPPGQGPSTTSGTGITVTGDPTSTRSFETFTNTPSTSSETTTSSSSSSTSSATTSPSTTSDTTSVTSITSVSTTEVPTPPSTTLSTSSSISSDATSSGTFSSSSSTSSGALPSDTTSTSSSASVETSSSGSPGSPSTGSSEPSSTGSPVSPSTSSPDAPSTGSPDVSSASSAETPGSSETSDSTAESVPSSTATSTPGTVSSPSFPTPSGTSDGVEPSGSSGSNGSGSGNTDGPEESGPSPTGPSGSSPGFGGPGTTPSTVVIPTEPTDAPGETPVAPPSSAVAQLPAVITLVAMLFAAVALLL
ncbi:Agglutinin-like protein [Paramyrothecium foliicola]|nr:Agglutinin-like protein [Paramyrothecium foliicola]